MPHFFPGQALEPMVIVKGTENSGSEIGASFQVSLPRLTLKNRKVLIVADDRAKVGDLTDILRAGGYLLFTVNSCDAALDCFDEFEPDLVLLDLELPGVHVFETCRMFCSRRSRTAPTVIFLAARSDPAELVEGFAAGGVDYLARPYREQEVLARLRVHLLNRQRLVQLVQKEKAKNRLLCMAAHDLRNPLVSIRALTNVLRAGTVGGVSEEQRDLLDTVYDASQSMLDLVNELLDASLLEAGELKLTLRSTSLSEVIAASIRLSNATAAEKGSFITWARSALPAVMLLDEPKVRQVLNNLLSNAIKFSPPASTITVVTEMNSTHCAIAIRDQGPGVPEGERARLFKEFSRTSVRPTGGESSTGLGLAICHRIMQAHSGTIRAHHAPGGGAEFRITFPIDS